MGRLYHEYEYIAHRGPLYHVYEYIGGGSIMSMLSTYIAPYSWDIEYNFNTTLQNRALYEYNEYSLNTIGARHNFNFNENQNFSQLPGENRNG